MTRSLVIAVVVGSLGVAIGVGLSRVTRSQPVPGGAADAPSAEKNVAPLHSRNRSETNASDPETILAALDHDARYESSDTITGRVVGLDGTPSAQLEVIAYCITELPEFGQSVKAKKSLEDWVTGAARNYRFQDSYTRRGRTDDAGALVIEGVDSELRYELRAADPDVWLIDSAKRRASEVTGRAESVELLALPAGTVRVEVPEFANSTTTPLFLEVVPVRTMDPTLRRRERSVATAFGSARFSWTPENNQTRAPAGPCEVRCLQTPEGWTQGEPAFVDVAAGEENVCVLAFDRVFSVELTFTRGGRSCNVEAWYATGHHEVSDESELDTLEKRFQQDQDSNSAVVGLHPERGRSRFGTREAKLTILYRVPENPRVYAVPVHVDRDLDLVLEVPVSEQPAIELEILGPAGDHVPADLTLVSGMKSWRVPADEVFPQGHRLEPDALEIEPERLDGASFELLVESDRFGSKRLDVEFGGRYRVQFDRPTTLTVRVPQGATTTDRSQFAVRIRPTVRTGTDALFRAEDIARSKSARVLDRDESFEFGELAPGEIIVDLGLVEFGTSGLRRFFVLDSRTVTLTPSENILTLELPRLHDLVIRLPEGTTRLQVTPLGDRSDWNDIDGTFLPFFFPVRSEVAELSGVPEGRYEIQALGASSGTPSGSMTIDVRSAGTIEYSASPLDRIHIVLTNDRGALAAAGFEDGDRIIAIDGAPIDEAAARAGFNTLQQSDATSLTVLRNGRTIELAVDAKSVFAKFDELGGQFRPDSE